MRGHYRGRRYGGYYRGRGGARGGPSFGFQGPAQIKRDRLRSERTIIVRGFPAETNVADLTEFFQQYGDLENIMLNMDKTKGMYAMVVFEDKDSVTKVQAEPAVVMKETTLVIEEKKSRYDAYQESRKLNAEIVRHPDLTVYIKGIDKDTPDTVIKEFFSQFGVVTGILMRHDKNKEHFHYVQFEKKDEADAVIAMDAIDFHGNTLTTDAKKTKEEMTEARKLECNHSIYVQGFSEDTTEDQLVTLFSSAGQIEKVYMDSGRKGAYAFVEFNSPEAVEAAVALENLSIGDNLLIVKKRELKEDRKKKWQSPKQLYGPPKQVIDHMAVVKKLLEQNTVEDQMKTLQGELEMTAEDLQQRQEITQALQEIFVDYFPGCCVEQFGSSMNGFGVRGCDLDVFLDLNLDKELDPTQLEGYPKKAVPFVGDIDSLSVENGMITRDSLQNTSMPDRARLIHRVLTTSADHVFTGFLLFKSARCPIIRMIHTATEIRVDVSINNRLALNNTRLIRFYADYDPRIKPLYYTVRHWAKYKDVAGNPMSGPKLTNYALSMMVFHYLTVCHPPVLPTVEQLASLADKKTLIDGWDCSLVSDKSKAPFPLNNEPLVDLLAGFFHYFASYDFGAQVMKTRTSQLLDKAAFQAEIDAEFTTEVTESETSPEKKKVPRITSLCILDPFVTNHNITGNVNNRARFRIKYEFEQATAKMQHERFLKTSVSEPQPSVDWGLTFLFSRDRLRVNTLDDAAQLSEHGINLLHTAPYHLPISMKISQLPQNLLQPGPEREAFKDTWTNEILVFIQRILTELMLVDCSDASEVLNQQLAMLDEDTSVNANGQCQSTDDADNSMEVETKRLKLEKMDPKGIILALKCSTRYRMWQNRKQLKKDTRVQMPDLDEFLLESQVTQKLIKLHPPNLDSVIEFYLTFSKEQTAGFTVIRMSMYPTIGPKEFTCFFAFLSAFVAKIVDKCFIIKS